MMIVKQDQTSFYVFDVLGQMGIWRLDLEGLERYLAALESKRASSPTAVRAFPLLENTHGPEQPRAAARPADDIFSHGLPDTCFFDTRIVLARARTAGKGIITPPSLSLDVNALCNYDCRWCCADVHQKNKGAPLDIQDIETWIIRPLALSGNLTWYLVGGEPALTPERTVSIAEMIVTHTAAYSTRTPFIAMDSNGTAFAKNAGLFQQSGINSIQFSLSSTDADKDRYLRGCPAGVDPVQTIIQAIEAAKSHDLHCGINMVLWKENERDHNLNDVEAVVGLGAALGVDFIRITPAVQTNVSARNGMRLEKADLKKVGRTLADLVPAAAAESGAKIVSMLLSQVDDGDQSTDRPMTCRAGTCFLHADHKGDLFPCAMLMPDFRIGHAVRDDLLRLWYDDNPLTDWREVLDVSPECAVCQDRNYCVGKCPAYAWFKFGDISLSAKPLDCPLHTDGWPESRGPEGAHPLCPS